MGVTINPSGNRFRGAIPTPRHRLLGATPHRIVGATPAQFFWKFGQLDPWLNNQKGCCVSSEECFNISVAGANAGTNDFIDPNTTLETFLRQYGYANGAALTDVMDTMAAHGMPQFPNTYTDGGYTGVDYSTASILQNAIANGVVKIGVDAGQLENAVNTAQGNGWYGVNFRRSQNIDHCTALSGYGPMGWLYQQLGMSAPSAVNPNAPGYAFFTWGSVGIVDASVVNIMGEAWLRSPSSIRSPAYPTPTPPEPDPLPPVEPPGPSNGFSGTITLNGVTYSLSGTSSLVTQSRKGEFSDNDLLKAIKFLATAGVEL